MAYLVSWKKRSEKLYYRRKSQNSMAFQRACNMHWSVYEFDLNHTILELLYFRYIDSARALYQWYKIAISNLPWVLIWYDRRQFMDASVHISWRLKSHTILTFSIDNTTSLSVFFRMQGTPSDRSWSEVSKNVLV